MKIHVPIHSVVDVITNSSSVIYTEATTNAVVTMKEIVNSILELGGSEKTVDDLYDISIRKMPADGLVEWLHYEVNDLPDDAPDNIVEIVKKMEAVGKDYTSKRALAAELVQKHEAELFEYFTTYEDWYEESAVMFLDTLVIETKDGVNTQFDSKILSMFNSYEGER